MSEEFKATILAGRLKHTISVLRRMNDEAIFVIDNEGMHCKLNHIMNEAMVHISMPRAAFETYDVEDMRIGIDLDKLTRKILKRATVTEGICIEGDKESWTFTRGIHQKTTRLLQPDRLRKWTTMPDLPHTAAMILNGKEFKDIVAEASDISDQVVIRATSDALTVEAESGGKILDRYKCTLPSDRYKRYDSETTSIYSLELLQDVATDLKASDDMLFRFSSDMPCDISYERDGVKILITIAPRIESD